MNEIEFEIVKLELSLAIDEIRQKHDLCCKDVLLMIISWAYSILQKYNLGDCADVPRPK